MDFLFKYLDKEKIRIDKNEFYFQFNSHPYSPSLLAISDTLSFFNIKNASFKIETSEINLLPQRFIARLKENNVSYLSFVEKKENSYSYLTPDNQKINGISKTKFETLFDNVILLAESDNDNKDVVPGKISFFIAIPFLVVLALILYTNFSSFWISAFYVFPLFGLLLSILALKDLFDVRSRVLDRFCNITSNYSCETVVNSTKWKVFDKINFSDLSITFFSFQIISLFIMGFSLKFEDFFTLQLLLILISSPLHLLSLYYQRFVEKKMCLLCISIIAIVVSEFIYILTNTTWNLSIAPNQILLHIFIYLSILMIWFPVKDMLRKVKKLKEEAVKHNRFKRNYTVFRNNLLSKPKYDLPINPIKIKGENSKLEITVITNPNCGACTLAHEIINEIINKDEENNLSLSVIFNFNDNHSDNNLKLLLGNLINSKLIDDTIFKEAMDSWFKNRDFDKWIKTYGMPLDINVTDSILEMHKNWCKSNEINFTPCILINGYEYPNGYEFSDLPFFIDELIEDSI